MKSNRVWGWHWHCCWSHTASWVWTSYSTFSETQYLVKECSRVGENELIVYEVETHNDYEAHSIHMRAKLTKKVTAYKKKLRTWQNNLHWARIVKWQFMLLKMHHKVIQCYMRLRLNIPRKSHITWGRHAPCQSNRWHLVYLVCMGSWDFWRVHRAIDRDYVSGLT